eukprot:CAMPEP_0179439028 /NCGR_PEP_ID=MMETSP0799-20121207/22676_1 /TAXON_ID=46947 /ORGANISM="Geminigera cryophila, Strain CCMP2564" /LENGTH=207 /DNA_ID=CAMNT_0021221065 /DNA_START=223 /DNA_END=842 /DNA_ORIENTATION=+
MTQASVRGRRCRLTLILVLVWCVSHSSVLGDTFEASKAFVSDGSTAASAQCSLYIVYPRNLSHPLRTAPDLHFRACSGCPTASPNPLVTVKVAGGKQVHIDAQLQEPADATGGVDSNMASCRYLITFSIPTTRLQEGVKCSAPPAASCQGAGGGLGAMESSDFEFEKSWHHDPAWQSLTISVHVQGPTAEVALSSLIFVSLSGWWGA